MRCGDESLAAVQAPAVAPTGPDSAGVLHTPGACRAAVESR